ncbi:MAG: nuclease-related domain-containing protein [Rhodoglobus sp.]
MSHSRLLRARIAGQSAMCEVVSAQKLAQHRSVVARVFGVSPLTAPARAAYRGALGELLVGDVLKNLGHRWDVLHGLPLTLGSLDHLVIGPTGVFTVHTANCSGTDVTIDDDSLVVLGERRDDILNARAEAEETAQLLSAAVGYPVRVRPLLVVVDPKRLTVKTAASVVRVIASKDLDRFMREAPQVMSGEEVAIISDLADLNTTWPAAGPSVADTQQLHQNFSEIRSQVRGALLRRIIWAGAATVIIYVSVWAVVAALTSVLVEQ